MVSKLDVTELKCTQGNEKHAQVSPALGAVCVCGTKSPRVVSCQRPLYETL